MSENRKQKSLTPILLTSEDASYHTVNDLREIIKNDDVLNIAVTGPYGSGKSSVLKTFVHHAGSDVRILDISLATLDAEEDVAESEIGPLDEDPPTAGPIGKAEKETPNGTIERTSVNTSVKKPAKPPVKKRYDFEQKELLNRKIEFSILQQLVYRKTLDRLPFSRLKKIRHIPKRTISNTAFLFVLTIVVFAFATKSSLFQIPVLYKTLGISIGMQNAISICSIILLLAVIYSVVVYVLTNFNGLKLQNISLGGSKIDMRDEGSIFNRYLDEILYFFQCTDYNVVIIEDLDRFDNTDIFLKLRELNHLINKSEMVGRTVKFIYAVKDDLFKDSARTKFFDYITTVIPVITTKNSKDKLKEALADLGHEYEISDDDIRDIAFHIDDMRLLQNIVNEYHQYAKRLNNPEHPMEARKMLAMMTVKNYFPRHFSDLHRRRGCLYDALSHSARAQYIKMSLEVASVHEEKEEKMAIEAYIRSSHLSEKELRIVYLHEIFSLLKKGAHTIIIDSKEYSFNQIVEDGGVFEKLISQDPISYRYTDNYHNNYPESTRNNFVAVERKVDPDNTYNQRLEYVRSGYRGIENKLEQIKLERNRIEANTISELLENYNLYDSDYFKNLGLSKMEEDFIRRGLIAEDYNDYISYFYPNIMSEEDHQLSLDMRLNREVAHDAHIDNVKLFIKELPISAMRYKSVWNYNILNYLYSSKAEFQDHYRLITDTLIRKDSVSFFYEYLQSGGQAEGVFMDCMRMNSFEMLKSYLKSDSDNRISMIMTWFRVCDLSEIRSEHIDLINANYDIVEKCYDELPVDKQHFFTTKMNYEELDKDNSNMLRVVVQNGCYVLNIKNIHVVVEVKCAKDDISLLTDAEEMRMAIQFGLIDGTWKNILTYFNESKKRVDSTLMNFVSDNITDIYKDESCRGVEYKELFLSLLECQSFADSVYAYICSANSFSVSHLQDILEFDEKKVLSLIKSGAFEYDLKTLKSMNAKSPDYAAEYVCYHKVKLEEIIKSGLVAGKLAEAVLMHGGFNEVDYRIIIASLTTSKIGITETLANKICAIMSHGYTKCDESILTKSISACTNESYAVGSVARKIEKEEASISQVQNFLGLLPMRYHNLIELGANPKLNNTPYNKLLIEVLQSKGLISSYTEEKNHIKINSKRKR